jgi:DNA repair exonuclease SbcCD ATPase subunit
MRLLELELSNFKGIRSLRLVFNGNEARIYGDNATGKTTIMDGFCWLTTGKDHTGRSDFNIKTLDESGAAIPMIVHSVRARIEHNGTDLELIRAFSEVWVKKNGTNTQSFSGHKTDYFINGVAKSEKEYQSIIDRMVHPQLLRLLAVVGYFNEQIKPEDRRRMLIDMCGDISDDDILSRPEFLDLQPLCSQFVTVADLKRQKAAEKTKINDEIKAIPIRIDTHTKYLNIGALSQSEEQGAVDELNDQLSAIDAELKGLYSGEYIAGLKTELAQLKAQETQARQEAASTEGSMKQEVRKKLNVIEDKTAEITGELSRLVYRDNGLITAIEDLEKKKAKALKEYDKVYDSSFSADDTCPTCGQPIPAEQLEGARALFNEQKATRLDEIVREGKALAEEIESKTAGRVEITEQRADLRKRLTEVDAEKKSAEAELSKINVPIRFDSKLITEKQAEIDAFNDSVSSRAAALRNQIAVLNEQRSGHERNLAAIDNAKKSAVEIEALKASEKTLSAAYEDCERIIALCDDFAKAKVELLDAKISGAFRFTKFKLSEAQINGGFKECCEATIYGVPYSAANNAARINCGLDIIETFSRAYGVTMPIFVDNAESITWLYPMDSVLDRPQVIQLIVSEPDKQLRLEVN